jgi:hypothetical protein
MVAGGHGFGLVIAASDAKAEPVLAKIPGWEPEAPPSPAKKGKPSDAAAPASKRAKRA